MTVMMVTLPWMGNGDNILHYSHLSPSSLPQSPAICYLLCPNSPAMQHSNVSMQLTGLHGPMLSSHEVISRGKLIHVVMPSDDY